MQMELEMAEIFRNRSACAKCWAGDRKRAGRWQRGSAFLVCGFCAWSIGRWVVINAMRCDAMA